MSSASHVLRLGEESHRLMPPGRGGRGGGGFDGAGSGGGTGKRKRGDKRRQQQAPEAGEGANLGRGVKWDLRFAVKRTWDRQGDVPEPLQREVRSLRRLAQGLLAQALGCSDQADVTFQLSSGHRPFKGHSSVLAATSEHYAAMFEADMIEAREGVIPIPPGISEASFKGFLEFMYLGRCGRLCSAADGRQLLVLSEMHQMPGLREWLIESLGYECILGAYEFSLMGLGDRSDVAERCLELARKGLVHLGSAQLRGAGAGAVRSLIEKRLEECGNVSRQSVGEGVQFAKRWIAANGGGGGSGAGRLHHREVERVVGALDLGVMSRQWLAREVGGSGLLPDRALKDLLSWPGGRFDRAFRVEGMFGFDARGEGLFGENGLRHLAVHGEGDDQRVAGVDVLRKRVLVFSVATGSLLFAAGGGEGEGQLVGPVGCAFSPVPVGGADEGGGELFVSDDASDRVLVYDRRGAFVRAVGCGGRASGKFRKPRGLAFTTDGELVVVDSLGCRVLRQDGSFVREIGSMTGNRALQDPFGVAVSPSGGVVISDVRSNRVLCYGPGGDFAREVTAGGVVRGVAVAAGGEVLVADAEKNCITVHARGVGMVQVIGTAEDGLPLNHPHGLCVDGEGRVFVGCTDLGNILMLS